MYPEQYAITVQCTVILYRTVYTKQYIYTRDGNTGQYIKLILPFLGTLMRLMYMKVFIVLKKNDKNFYSNCTAGLSRWLAELYKLLYMPGNHFSTGKARTTCVL